jgi:hypothetical protein
MLEGIQKKREKMDKKVSTQYDHLTFTPKLTSSSKKINQERSRETSKNKDSHREKS